MTDRPTASTITDDQLDALYAERNQLAAALREVLAEFRFDTHPGRPCKRTGHISIATVERWRAPLDCPAARPHQENL